MGPMAGFEHLLKSFDVGDQIDEIASSDPPAYLRRCFAEGLSSPEMSLARAQQITVCGMVLDSILHDRGYEKLEPELIADWRAHYLPLCAPMQDTAAQAVRRALARVRIEDPEDGAELEQLAQRLKPA
jgi:hypothetical protein